ncbi:MAG: hypothetical protein GXY54_02395 [Deltaproteobacteria bacterium]|nr:hypothetical protein [Deltaproteobacteria bacterium]
MADTTILPKGEDLRRAVLWLSEEGKDRGWSFGLVAEASRRFNLSPKDEEFLIHFLNQRKNGGSA